jgi:enoyl-CoA hydratase / 3-hydroxyacyl-CoA dehydrogenase
MAEIRNVVVVGAGNMGSGIAQSAAQGGYRTTMVDTKPEFLEAGLARIRGPLEKRVAQGKMKPAALEALFSNLSTSTDLEASVKDADLVIEAVFEDAKVKSDLFARVAKAAKPTCIAATNTSSLSVSELAKAFGDASRFGGLHYFFPAAVNKLVEVVKGKGTSDATFESLKTFALSCKKIPIKTADRAGFAVNRFFVPLLNEACRILEEGEASIPTIEAASNAAFGTGMGPFELMNVTGIPIAFHAQTTLYNGLGAFYKPSAKLKAQFEAKTNWDLSGEPQAAKVETVADRLRGVIFGIVCHLVEEGVATPEATDRGAVVGLRWSQGPFELMNQIGTSKALSLVEAVAARWKEDFPKPAALVKHAAQNTPWDLATVAYEEEGRVATITIDRPEALNALNPKVLHDLERALRRAEESRGVRAVILTGSGKSFVAGADIKTMAEQTAVESIAYTQQGQRVIRYLELMNTPVIGAINGWALGGGCELALACDILVASKSAQFALPEVGLGIHPGFGGTQRLPRMIGPMRAKEWIFTGDRFSAEAAQAVGLVNKVVADDELMAECRRIADKIAEHAPLAIGLAKGAVNRGLGTDIDSGLALEAQSVTLTFATDDQKEGMRAFLERRKPDFKGR